MEHFFVRKSDFQICSKNKAKSFNIKLLSRTCVSNNKKKCYYVTV